MIVTVPPLRFLCAHHSFFLTERSECDVLQVPALSLSMANVSSMGVWLA